MDITLDFTQEPKPTLSDIAKHPYLRSVTFVLQFFQESKNNFSVLWDFITFLNDKPLVKVFIKPQGEQIKPKYKTVALGGTFDHLHIGHQVLLLHAVLSAEKKVIVGITSQQMLEKKVNKEIIQSILMRINEVREFVRKIKTDIELVFPELTDPYGPTVTDEDIDAIIVSPQTYKTGQVINEIRSKKGFHPLAIQNCPIMAPVHHLTSIKQIENKISSTQIRAHLLAKNGFTIQEYAKYQQFWFEMVRKINKLTGSGQNQKHLLSRKWWDIVVKYYSQYWRFFHTNHHINSMFLNLKASPEFGYDKLTELQQIALSVSIFFHDIIYRPDLNNNQQESARFAQSFIDQIWGHSNPNQKQQLVNKVTSAILATKSHKSSNQVQKILNELDISILDSPLPKYQTYAFNVQREYSPLYKQNYPKSRVQFLKNHLLGYEFTWRKGENLKSNIEWEISHWNQTQQEL